MGHNDHMSEADDRRMRRQTKSNRRTPPVLLPKQPGQFGEFAMCYWDNGLKAIPAENKIPLVAGATGHEGTARNQVDPCVKGVSGPISGTK